MTLNIMVLESDRGTADIAAAELTAAGHQVLRCHEPLAPAFPCRGLEDQSACPLRSHVVDVALTVRSHPSAQPSATEDGVRCALMHHVPLVVAGPALFDPFDNYGVRTIERTGAVVSACEEVAAAVLARHSAVATGALRASPTSGDALTGAAASVTRRDGRLRIVVSGLDALAPRQRDAAIVRTLGKVREFDRSARGIDVVLTSDR